MNQKVLPLPGVALDTDIAAHQLRQALGDRQPQSGAAMLPGGGASACSNAWNNLPICSWVRPMPVSLTAKSNQLPCSSFC